MVGLQDHITASTAIAAAGSSLGDVGFPVEGDGALASMACTSVDLDLINEHNLRVRGTTKKARLRGAGVKEEKGRGPRSLAQESVITVRLLQLRRRRTERLLEEQQSEDSKPRTAILYQPVDRLSTTRAALRHRATIKYRGYAVRRLLRREARCSRGSEPCRTGRCRR